MSRFASCCIRSAVLVAMLFAAVTAAPGFAADEPAKGKTAKDSGKGVKDAGKAAKESGKAAAAAKPACMRCGATCGLEPVCVCEPGTKKRSKTEFDVECGPICIAGCGDPFGKSGGASCTGCAGGCTSDQAAPCSCRGRIRNVKKLSRRNVDEEVPTVVRTVKYVCDCCAGRCGAGCCGGSPRHGTASWWSRLFCWWPQGRGG